MVSTAWKFYEDDGVEYRIQFDEVPWKLRKALLEAMKDWTNIAFGWNNKTGNQVLIFNKKFPTQEAWETWARSFPTQIKEKRFWGNKEKVLTYGKK